jgi:phage protein U
MVEKNKKSQKAQPFCTLGDLTFELLRSPNSLQTGWDWNYVEHERILGKPLLQIVGGKLRTINLRFKFHHSFCNPQEELDKLLKMANKQEAVALVLGEKMEGYWVIESIPLTVDRTDAQALLLSIEVDVNLKEWVDTVAKKPPKKQGFKKRVRA